MQQLDDFQWAVLPFVDIGFIIFLLNLFFFINVSSLKWQIATQMKTVWLSYHSGIKSSCKHACFIDTESSLTVRWTSEAASLGRANRHTSVLRGDKSSCCVGHASADRSPGHRWSPNHQSWILPPLELQTVSVKETSTRFTSNKTGRETLKWKDL